MARSFIYKFLRVMSDKSSAKSMFAGLLLVLAAVGGLALTVWFLIVLLDLKHLNASGFTLP